MGSARLWCSGENNEEVSHAHVHVCVAVWLCGCVAVCLCKCARVRAFVSMYVLRECVFVLRVRASGLD